MPSTCVLVCAGSYPGSSTTISYVLGGRLRTSKWPSKSVRTLRKIPTACDFSFTATWLAGRLPVFSSTVPEMIPSVCSELGSCALAVGAQITTVMLMKRKGRNPAVKYNFFTFFDLHSISTCCALLRCFLRRLGGWGSQFLRPRTATSDSHFRLRLWSRQRIAPFPPVTNRRVRGPMPGYMHRACHNVRQFVRCQSGRRKIPRTQLVSAA